MKVVAVTAAGAFALASLTACSAGSAASGSTIVAAFYPFAYVAERVAGNHFTVENLTAAGVEPHDLELSPQQVADISVADLLVFESGFQPAVDDAAEQNPPSEIIDVTDVVDLQDTGGEAEDGGDELGHTDLEGDPHLWLDPNLLVPIAEKIADRLSEIDPKHRADYAANAESLASDLRQLDREFRHGLSDCQRTEFVTSHAAFGYLAQRYGLQMIPIAGLTPDVEPSPEQLAEIQDLIDAHGITTVFSEALGSEEFADTLAD